MKSLVASALTSGSLTADTGSESVAEISLSALACARVAVLC